jgi:TPR repeat protein
VRFSLVAPGDIGGPDAECDPVNGENDMQMVFENLAETAIPLPQSEATGDELFHLGLLYSTGQGGAPLDLISAHMLFNLAAMRGSEEAKAHRRELSAEMDRDSVAEAQRAAREWLQHTA